VAPLPIRAGAPWLVALVLEEIACIAMSLLRFRRLPATHSYLAKAYGAALALSFLSILLFDGPSWVLRALGLLGTVANLEILAILFLSPTAPIDVLSLKHARRRGPSRSTSP